MVPRQHSPAAVFCALGVSGCAGEQSWLDPAGKDAELIGSLFLVMLASALLIWSGVMALALYAARWRRRSFSRRTAGHFILVGGILFPTVTLFALLITGLLVLREITGRTADLTVSVEGEQWWWRIAHAGPGGDSVPTPNELRLPVGRTAEMTLTADGVIHSFWVPALGGKMDMIPGRVNRITLTPTRTGRFRGQCAEYCGGAHAQMAFPTIVMAPSAFSDWLENQARPARGPDTERARRGLELFLSTGCGACHTIRGTQAEGRVGPDLTHVGSRATIGAGTLPMSLENMRRWIAAPDHAKPGVRMPSFAMLPESEIALIAEYLVGLE